MAQLQQRVVKLVCEVAALSAAVDGARAAVSDGSSASSQLRRQLAATHEQMARCVCWSCPTLLRSMAQCVQRESARLRHTSWLAHLWQASLMALWLLHVVCRRAGACRLQAERAADASMLQALQAQTQQQLAALDSQQQQQLAAVQQQAALAAAGSSAEASAARSGAAGLAGELSSRQAALLKDLSALSVEVAGYRCAQAAHTHGGDSGGWRGDVLLST